ncbi:hypothetical protein CY34DRAFT_801445 [Suillus luteus UH-Slu-Lm8-n1]|uniref:Uncharacterized protein n=1 Tax=Suillus luteus UH-Slu-Lm8-n1 TaxID=930992 RepID=A0A0D0BHH6_9AGAM|nr:hypothetical protein CY34DRAFT_801445 [Suillus luteus UH-Slu-Lm8-n1]
MSYSDTNVIFLNEKSMKTTISGHIQQPKHYTSHRIYKTPQKFTTNKNIGTLRSKCPEHAAVLTNTRGSNEVSTSPPISRRRWFLLPCYPEKYILYISLATSRHRSPIYLNSTLACVPHARMKASCSGYIAMILTSFSLDKSPFAHDPTLEVLTQTNDSDPAPRVCRIR